MKNILPNAVADLLARYEQKCTEEGLKFTPPEDKAELGRYAFSEDLITQILVGVASGILVEVAKAAIIWAKDKLNSDQNMPNHVISETLKSSSAATEGIQLLEQQGIQHSEAESSSASWGKHCGVARLTVLKVPSTIRLRRLAARALKRSEI